MGRIVAADEIWVEIRAPGRAAISGGAAFRREWMVR
jgi:hypothetical protein